ncbi:MAG TPA: NUDIX hydrolase [Phycisphaerae bacterium]|nr:NUDIX hydrolase [Phycisphaerae bacterium]
MDDTPVVLAEGMHLRFMRKRTWEYVDRLRVTDVVGIVAVTDDDKLILVEQYRPPVDKNVIELPAGLVGDEPGQTGEELLAAACRELQEETGYFAGELSILASGPISAGLSSEVITLILARKLRKLGPGGGVDTEAIQVHEVLLSEVDARLMKWVTEDKLVDLKVYAAQHFALTRDHGDE